MEQILAFVVVAAALLAAGIGLAFGRGKQRSSRADQHELLYSAGQPLGFIPASGEGLLPFPLSALRSTPPAFR